MTSPQVGSNLPLLMKRAGAPVSLETLLEESRFILRTLQRSDLFGDQVKLTEAERVLDHSISLNFADYCEFLSKQGYVQADPAANTVAVTDEGVQAARGQDPDLHARVARHFSKELEAAVTQPPEAVLPRPKTPAGRSTSRSSEDLLDRRYRKEAWLGEGILGPVYVGRHVALGRRVAIKEVKTIFTVAAYLRRDEILLRLKERLEAQAALVHPFVLSVLDQNLDREVPYLVQGLAHENLRNLLDKETVQEPDSKPEAPSDRSFGLAIATAVRVLLQLAEALRYAHDQGVVHGNLKPENVLLDPCGNVLLTDFGMSSIGDREVDAQTQRSNPPIVIGSSSVAYLPPERFQNGTEASVGADLYAFGLLSYELMIGRLPGRRSPLPSEVRPEIPRAFDDVFDRLTQDAVSERFQSFEDAIAALREALPEDWTGAAGTVPFAVAPVPKPTETEMVLHPAPLPS